MISEPSTQKRLTDLIMSIAHLLSFPFALELSEDTIEDLLWYELRPLPTFLRPHRL